MKQKIRNLKLASFVLFFVLLANTGCNNQKDCQACQGTGVKNCVTCNGKGSLIGGFTKCFPCSGSGKLNCSVCNGTGKVSN